MCNEVGVVIPAIATAYGKGDVFNKNYLAATCGSGHLPMEAGDQATEHFKKSDFFGVDIPEADLDPELLIRIANEAGVPLAVHLGYIDRYAGKYRGVPLIAKVNTQTDLHPGDPHSAMLGSYQMIDVLLEHGINVVGLGLTFYPGSEFEATMQEQVACGIQWAHSRGLIAVLWNYYRGSGYNALKADKELCKKIVAANEVSDVEIALTINAARVANDLGADFVKLNKPKDVSFTDDDYRKVVAAAGNTGCMWAGGDKTGTKGFIEDLIKFRNLGFRGAATGRNIHQHEYPVAFASAIKHVLCDGANIKEAEQVYCKAGGLDFNA
jgi:DhnA family fructose-bisphosphate aldolase class Ia